MIDFYYWPTPNGWKVGIMLEECGLDYNTVAVNIGRGDQFKPEFLAISPNNKMPAIVDHDGPDGPISVYESGAILLYLAEKAGRFAPTATLARYQMLQWLFWQVGNLGPMAGQLSHFVNYAPEPMDYPLTRYRNEYNRLLGVIDRQLGDSGYMLGEYSIVDMASWPWIRPYRRFEQPLEEFPNVKGWHERMKASPAVRRACDLGREWTQGDRPD